jgi:hypothetical protein
MYDYNKFNTKILDIFDNKGFVVEHIQFDTSGQKIVYKSKLKYDSSQKLISEIIINYLCRYDSSTKTMNLTAQTDTLVAKIEYDSMNRIIKKEFKNSLGKIINEEMNTFNPLIKTEKIYTPNDSIYSETIYFFDRPYIENKLTFTRFLPNGKQKVWNFEIKNHFDKTGKITDRSIERDPEESDSENPQPYFRNESFQYMKNGLLLNKLSSNLSDNTGRISRQIFDYKFW